MWLVCGVFFGLSLVAFGPAIRAPFDFDDLPAIVNNVTIRRMWPPDALLSPPGLETAVSGRPIANYSFAGNYAINRWLGIEQSPDRPSRFATVGYHAGNLVIHVVAGILIFLIVRLTLSRGRVPENWRSRPDALAFVIATIWLIHPIQTEAVDYISQRTELLAGAFVLLTLYASIRASGTTGSGGARSDGSRGWALVAVAACALGMLSKETAVAAPVLVALYDRAFTFESWRAAVAARRRLYAALAVTYLIPVASIVLGTRTRTAGFRHDASVLSYLVTQGWAIPHYVVLTLWPHPLVHDYGAAPIAGAAAWSGLAALCALGFVAVAAWRPDRWRWLAFLLSGAFVVLAPSSSFIPIATEVAAERRFYLALAFLVTGFVVAAESLRRRIMAGSQARQRTRVIALAGAAAGALVLALTAVASARSAQYGNPEVLWRGAATANPRNPRALEQLAYAIVRSDSSRLAEADSLYRRSLTIDGGSAAAWLSVAAIEIHRDNLAAAETLLTHALRASPGDSAATDRLAAVLTALGRPAGALPYLRQLVSAFPGAKTEEQLGIGFLNNGDLDSAAHALRAAIRLDSTRASALEFLGAALVEEDSGAQAIGVLSRAATIDSEPSFAYGLLSIAYGQAGRQDDGVRAAREALRRPSKDPLVIVLAGRGLQASGDIPDAIATLRRAISENPGDPEALTRLGLAELANGDRPAARQLFDRALAIAPGFGLARLGLERMKER